MTQRIFDRENEKDMADLWDILPDEVLEIRKNVDMATCFFVKGTYWGSIPAEIIKINWHNKTEITRPIQEATEDDIGKICYFWNDDDDFYGKLDSIFNGKFGKFYCLGNGHSFSHCRRLIKKEIEELC